MTNKKQLQKEIKDEGYISDNSSRNNRNNKDQSEQQKNNLSLKRDKQIKQLEQQKNFEAQKAQNYLTQITKLTAELDGANLEIKELKKIKPTKTQQELEKALIEANQKIRDQQQTIQELETEKEAIISQAEQTRNEQAEIIIKLEEQIKGTVDNLLLEQLQEQNREYKEKISKLEREIKNLNKNKPENKDNSQGEQKLFTCSQCQQEWSKEFIRLVDQNGNKTCVECVEKMLNLASKESGKEINLETEEKEPPKTHICRFCRQEKPTNQIKDRHIKNLPDGTDPREIVKVCQDCLTYRAIKADYYCPRTSEGRDTYGGSEFDCYCPQTKYF